MNHINKLDDSPKNVEIAIKAFLELDKVALEGIMIKKCEALITASTAITTPYPYCLEIHEKGIEAGATK